MNQKHITVAKFEHVIVCIAYQFHVLAVDTLHFEAICADQSFMWHFSVLCGKQSLSMLLQFSLH
jgi:hypothetical protein